MSLDTRTIKHHTGKKHKIKDVDKGKNVARNIFFKEFTKAIEEHKIKEEGSKKNLIDSPAVEGKEG